jgi:hypothetical protein
MRGAREKRDVYQLARLLDLGSSGRQFESDHPDDTKTVKKFHSPEDKES